MAASRLGLGVVALVALTASGGTRDAAAAGKLTFYCSAQEEWCQQLSTEFEKATGISVAMTRKSTGEVLAQLRSEKDNPKGDVWWGGTGDPHLQAAEEGLTAAYTSPVMADLQPWAQAVHKISGNRTVGVYLGPLGYGYNSEIIAKKGLTAPACWSDLVKPEYRGDVQMANPNSSGTAYTALATFVQLWGEEKGFDYLKQLHANISQYTKSGSAPIKAAAQGETAVGIVFLGDAIISKGQGAPVVPVSPCEGTGYEIGSMSLIEGGRNEDEARQFYDFVLRPDIQTMAADIKANQLPSNTKATPAPDAPDLTKLKLIDYDFKKYGSAAERTRLLKRWDEEVYTLPH